MFVSILPYKDNQKKAACQWYIHKFYAENQAVSRQQTLTNG